MSSDPSRRLGSLHHVLLDLAPERDQEEIRATRRQKDPRGGKACEPRMWTESSAKRLVVLLLCAYCFGVPSSRRIENACWEDAAFRVLIGNQQPEHSRIRDFRRWLEFLSLHPAPAWIPSDNG